MRCRGGCWYLRSAALVTDIPAAARARALPDARSVPLHCFAAPQAVAAMPASPAAYGEGALGWTRVNWHRSNRRASLFQQCRRTGDSFLVYQGPRHASGSAVLPCLAELGAAAAAAPTGEMRRRSHCGLEKGCFRPRFPASPMQDFGRQANQRGRSLWWRRGTIPLARWTRLMMLQRRPCDFSPRATQWAQAATSVAWRVQDVCLRTSERMMALRAQLLSCEVRFECLKAKVWGGRKKKKNNDRKKTVVFFPLSEQKKKKHTHTSQPNASLHVLQVAFLVAIGWDANRKRHPSFLNAIVSDQKKKKNRASR